MTASVSQIRTYRILGFFAVAHSAMAQGFLFLREGTYLPIWPWFWLAFTTSLFFWPFILALHPGRSFLRFLAPIIVAGAVFVFTAPFYRMLIYEVTVQWMVASRLERILQSNPKVILYSKDPEYQKPLEIKEGYRRLDINEIILPDDVFENSIEFVQMDKTDLATVSMIGQTVNSVSDESIRSHYNKGWQILRNETPASNEAEAKAEVPPTPVPDDIATDHYKSPVVLGYAEITDRAEQRALITALASGVRNASDTALCHNPRHGLHIQTDSFTIDVSICFECSNILLLGPPKDIENLGPFAGYPRGIPITDTPRTLFDAVLKKHGIPIAAPEYGPGDP